MSFNENLMIMKNNLPITILLSFFFICCILLVIISAKRTLAEVYLADGRFYLQHLSIKEALNHLNTAIRLYPYDGRAYTVKGYAYLKLNDHFSAINDLIKACYYDPYNVTTLQLLRKAYILAGNKNMADIQFNKIKKIAPFIN